MVVFWTFAQSIMADGHNLKQLNRFFLPILSNSFYFVYMLWKKMSLWIKFFIIIGTSNFICILKHIRFFLIKCETLCTFVYIETINHSHSTLFCKTKHSFWLTLRCQTSISRYPNPIIINQFLNFHSFLNCFSINTCKFNFVETRYILRWTCTMYHLSVSIFN